MSHQFLWKFLQAEMTLRQFENLSPPIMKQVLPLVEQLPPLYMELVNGREDFAPKPEETRRLVSEPLTINKLIQTLVDSFSLLLLYNF